MADEATTPEAAAEQPQVKMQVLGQFIRDMSFENILAQKGAKGEVKPELKVEVALDAKKRSTENQYEVVTKFKVQSQNAGTAEPLFLLELDYAGIFHIENIPEAQLHPFLLIECPRMLFPFVRRIVSDVTRDGGFPPVNLDSVDFVSLYRQELARRTAAEQAAAPTN
ncbi:protein-export chaperone SecB [Sinisalibacter aestuarii]|uniref:Protein-export protein SecB n=1 Tax=Sinisalibacter aestuarii TaxID=2949426 RepID=A0ABQ5LN56_9RHOB|nr:protein-export chaperone SecB [Sinisalibacter aestuarii]GKY86444.1 protein-export protein SecB [Sinisalibacter aestuarii]